MERQTTVKEFVKGERRTHQIVVQSVVNPDERPHGYIGVTFKGTAKELVQVIREALGLKGDSNGVKKR